jgi:hypothetical protein
VVRRYRYRHSDTIVEELSRLVGMIQSSASRAYSNTAGCVEKEGPKAETYDEAAPQ